MIQLGSQKMRGWNRTRTRLIHLRWQEQAVVAHLCRGGGRVELVCIRSIRCLGLDLSARHWEQGKFLWDEIAINRPQWYDEGSQPGLLCANTTPP